MAAKFVVLIACIAVAAAGMVKRDAGSDIQKHAEEFQKTFSDQIGALANSKNTQELNKALKEGSDSFLQQLSVLSSSFQKAMAEASGKAKETFEKSGNEIKKAADDFRKQHPEVEKNAQEMTATLKRTVDSVLAETQKVAKEVADNAEETNKKLAPQLKSAYEAFVTNTQEFQKKLHEAANKKQ